MKPLLILPDGSQREVEPTSGDKFTLKELQDYVGGYIEIRHLPNLQVMIMNEEGKSRELPRNEIATSLACLHPDFDDYIVGNVIICHLNQLD